MNQEKYLKAVMRKLACSRKEKQKIYHDIKNDIEVAFNSGEKMDDIIKRMGSPEELAKEFNENMGVDSRRSKWKIIGLVFLIVAVLAFALYLYVRSSLPEYEALGTSGLYQQDIVEEEVSQVIEALNRDDDQALIAMADSSMRQAMEKQPLSQAKETLGELGEYQKITSQNYVEITQKGKTCVTGEIVALYEQRSVTYTISFDQDGKLIGLYMK